MSLEQQLNQMREEADKQALALFRPYIEQKIETAKWMMRTYGNAPFWQNEINKWERIRTQLKAKGEAA
ncbi:hypothetical protein [Shewanella sp.]|uniref:hypothetical protein n=1 Tax=Shewanella sp. TaxID=50422 RepID=UPI003D0D1C88